MIIKRFGETIDPPHSFFYETAAGVRVETNEETIAKLWCYWLTSLNCNRADKDGFTIFEFINPETLDISQLENWAK